MKTTQKGSTTIIIILIIVILAVIGYFAFRKSPEPATLPVVTNEPAGSNASSPTSKTTTPVNVVKSTTTWETLRNDQYHFQIDLPKDSLAIQSGDSSAQRIRYELKNPGINYFRDIEIKRTLCGEGQAVVINGTPFTRIMAEGYYGGMETGSIDATYCGYNQSQRYNINLTRTYPRNGADGKPTVAPDQATSIKNFDAEMKLLNFQFTNL